MLFAVLYFAIFFAIFRALKVPLRPALVAAVALTILGRALFAAAGFGPWAWAILGVLLTPYWLGPFLVHDGQRMAVAPALVPFDPSRHLTPEEIEAPRQDSIRALVAAGFRPVADLFSDDYMPNLTLRVGLLENAATRQQAIACGMWASVGAARTKATWVELMSKLNDGRLLLVNNSSHAGAFAPVKERIVELFPRMRDVVSLARVHRALTQRLRGTADVEPPTDGGDPATYLSRTIAREAASQVETGYLRVDERGGVFRPTAKGALLMTWKMLPPFSTIRRARIERRGMELLRTLGLDGGDGQAGGRSGASVSWVAAFVALIGLGAVANAALLPRIASLGAEAAPLPASFAVPADFSGAVLALERVAGTTAARLEVTDSLGTRRRVDGVVLGVPAPRAEALIAAAQPLFRERGFYLFRVDQNYGIGGEPDELALVPLADPYSIVSLIGTNGANYGLSTAAIVDTLRAIHRDEPFDLTGIGFDYLEGRFRHPVGNPVELAHRFYTFCPDIVHQGTGSVEALAAEIRKTNTLYCWWD